MKKALKKSNLLGKTGHAKLKPNSHNWYMFFALCVSSPSIYHEDRSYSFISGECFESKFIHNRETSGMGAQQGKEFDIYNA